MSEDNDKTRIKGASNGPAEGSSGLSPAEEEARRNSAQQKARELEKRLAEINARKSQRNKAKNQASKPANTIPHDYDPLANDGGSEPDDGNKTQFKPRKEDDKTRIKSSSDNFEVSPNTESPSQSQPQAEPVSPADSDGSTRIGSSSGSITDDVKSDKTMFKPRLSNSELNAVGAGETTTLNDAVVSAPTSGGMTPVDLSQYSSEELLKNRFVFEKVLGAGGMGVVYKAKDLLKVEAQDRDPFVAIKVLGDEFRSHPEAFIALQRESRKTQRIAHPNIVNVYDFDRDGDTVFMTMEYMEGKPLDKLISQYKSTGLPEEDCWKILEGLCAALIYAHAQNIIHSDFKPGNIFITKSNTAKVFDFGIARAVAKAEKFEDSVDDKTVFDAGNLGALTPAYASLEMLEGEPPDVRDDIYALGCIAYEMFSGNHPFNRVHANEAKRKKLKPKRLNNISKRQWRVIEKALAFKREDRVESVEEFWQQITSKRSVGILLTIIAMTIVAAGSFFIYQTYYAPKGSNFNEDEIRSEVERKFYIDQNTRDLEQLLGSLEFTSSWEARVWQAYQNLSKLLGDDDTWLLEQKDSLAKAYFAKIEALVSEQSFQAARGLLANARRYSSDGDALLMLAKNIDDVEAELASRIAAEKMERSLAAKQQKKQQNQEVVMAERNEAFDVAMSTVDKQLQCRSTINMSDIDIAVSKLRSLNASRYQKTEKSMVDRLSFCISKIGESFPDRALEFKKRAVRIFPDNRTIANIKITPKDPCDIALAGLGARGSRATCRDVLKSEGESFGRGPSLVVIPAKGSLRAFAIGKYELTYEDMVSFCDTSGKCKADAGTKLPVTDIDANLIQDYLVWLSDKSKRKYRLPTKAEWMYAARANAERKDPNRNCRLDSRGIKKGGVLVNASTGQQNNWGLVNYLGNARELVSSGGAYAAMGGSFETAIEDCVVATSESHTGSRDNRTGVRVLRELGK